MKAAKVTVTILVITLQTMAQSTDDAILFSQATFGPTARSLAMGGAMGGLGGDFSCMSQNPAGLGVYRRSEVTFTTGFNNRKVTNTYLGSEAVDSRFFMNVPSSGLVLSGYKPKKSGWKGFNFALGYTQDFTYKAFSVYSGVNKNNSLLNSYVEQANGVPVSSLDDINYAFGPGMAYNVYLMNPRDSGSSFYTAAINGGALQTQTFDQKGNIGNFVLSLANNFNDKLFIGGTFEFKSLRYQLNARYNELDFKDTIVSPYYGMNVQQFNLDRNEYTNGSALCLKFGVIAKPSDNIRLGVAIHSPAWYQMHYRDDYNMNAVFGKAGDSVFTLDAPPSSAFDYNFNTPFRALGSLAFVFPGRGLLSFDYEYVNNKLAKFREADQFVYNFSGENNVIRSNHAQQHIIKAGGEIIAGDAYFRAGAAYYSSPYEKGVVPASNDYSSMNYTGGVGYRKGGVFVDIGFCFTRTKQYDQFYALQNGDAPGTYSNTVTQRYLLTLGYKFN